MWDFEEIHYPSTCGKFECWDQGNNTRVVKKKKKKVYIVNKFAKKSRVGKGNQTENVWQCNLASFLFYLLKFVLLWDQLYWDRCRDCVRLAGRAVCIVCKSCCSCASGILCRLNGLEWTVSFRNLCGGLFFFLLQYASQYCTLCRLAAFSYTFVLFFFLLY